MALEATHILFAIDFAHIIGWDITNWDQYASGTVYPDSRYVTKIDRHLTHDEELFSKHFLAKSDFYKGWYAHLVCDHVQRQAFFEAFEYLFDKETKEEQWNDVWLKRTALKVLHDILLVKENPKLQSHIPGLAYIETPNGEPKEKVKEYNNIMIQLYKDKSEITIDDCEKMWIQFGIGEEMSNRVRDTTEQLNGEPEVHNKLAHIYERMLELAKEYTSLS